MPIYEYECTRCAHRFERIMKVGEADPACPACGAKETKRRLAPSGRTPGRRFLDGMEKRVSPEKFK